MEKNLFKFSISPTLYSVVKEVKVKIRGHRTSMIVIVMFASGSSSPLFFCQKLMCFIFQEQGGGNI